MGRTLAKWFDGFLLDCDARREDPLFYYRSEDHWETAIGLHILPEYQESNAAAVEIAVWQGHRQREYVLTDNERAQMYSRCVPALAAAYPRWKQIVLRATRLNEILRVGSLNARLGELGFTQMTAGEDKATWCRR
jgi:hypothetical protein